jgi:hypothetical protein
VLALIGVDERGEHLELLALRRPRLDLDVAASILSSRHVRAAVTQLEPRRAARRSATRNVRFSNADKASNA